MSKPTHLLVANPTAQSGKNQERIERARGLFRAAGVDCDFAATLPHGKTIDVVRDAIDSQPYSTVIYMGGDGTFREVASGLLRSGRSEDVALGMLPTGTANDQGRSFGLNAGEVDLERNVGVIVAAHETRLDAGLMTVPGADGEANQAEEHFFDSAGWGISARILATRNIDREVVKELGPLEHLYRDEMVYAGAALKVFLESYVVDDKFDVRVTADGEVHELTGLTDLIIKNTRVYGGSWVFDRDSKPDDGLMEVVPFRGKRDWTSKGLVGLDANPVTEEVLNAIGVSHSSHFRAATMTFEFSTLAGGEPLAAQMDGEEFLAASPTRVMVIPRAVRLIVPAPGG